MDIRILNIELDGINLSSHPIAKLILFVFDKKSGYLEQVLAWYR